MLPPSEPRWRRRKEDRPAEIIAAAQAVFAEKGFAAARLDDIARRAGLSKGALYLYFETKEDIFAAVINEAIAPRVATVIGLIEAYEGPFQDLARQALPRLASIIGDARIGGVVKMVIGESRNFPELARVWHERLIDPAIGLMSRVIERGQARGEIRSGDPRHHAFTLIAPMLLGVIWQETFTPVGARPIDLQALAAQHVETALQGLLTEGARS
jgi:AcrR family transcriptional regulator